MQKIICLFVSILLLSSQSKATTTITTYGVSGNWTLLGSPYLITGDIVVDYSSTLVIDPGVAIIFQGCYSFEIRGTLVAQGTSTNHISFYASDTLGWHNDEIANGGWRGIQYKEYTGFGIDSSVFSYCDICDTKYGSISTIGTKGGFACSRPLHVSYCTFSHCQCISSASDGTLVQFDSPNNNNQLVMFDGNEIFSCKAHRAIFYNENSNGSSTKIYDNNFHNNIGDNIVLLLWSKCVFNFNQIHHNSVLAHGAPLWISQSQADVLQNKIHHNVSEKQASLTCASGKVKIEGNLVCNNSQTSGFCGLSDGGGGIRLMHNDGIPFDSTYYVVRNNIIANNYAKFPGGGISVYHAKGIISNNHIINNESEEGGGGINIYDSSTSFTIKNNIFYGNKNYINAGALPGILSTHDINVSSAYSLEINNNWMEVPYYQMVYQTNLFTIVGDTLQNIIGINPLMISPTATSLVSDNALLANFSLQSTSSCIESGDTLHTSCSLTDFLGSQRFSGVKIDIGAFEKLQHNNLGYSENETITSITFFPNPATEKVNLLLNGENNSESNLLVTDAVGKVIFAQKYSKETSSIALDVASWNRGIYFVSVNNNSKHTKTLSLR